MDTAKIMELRQIIKESNNIVFFGGAGVSTESGIPDFRSADGIYNQDLGREVSPEEMISHTFFVRHTADFYAFYKDKLIYPEAKPNDCHKALAELERQGKLKAVVTQNIDGLHERAGSDPVFAVHGTAAVHHCRSCGDAKTFEEIRAIRGGVPGAVPRCKVCGGVYKPDITFFGEALPEDAFRGAAALCAEADLVVVLGSSLVVQPAASLPLATLRAGGRLAIVNRGETPLDRFAFFRGDDLAAFAEAAESLAS
jgi:NAD-dependent deacetylase